MPAVTISTMHSPSRDMPGERVLEANRLNRMRSDFKSAELHRLYASLSASALNAVTRITRASLLSELPKKPGLCR